MTSGNDSSPANTYKSFTGHEPLDLSSFIAPIIGNQAYVGGTAIKAIAPRFVQRADGLIVPEHLAAGPAPIDQMLVYLTTKEIFGINIPKEYIQQALSQINAAPVIAFVAEIMKNLRSPDYSQSDVDALYATRWFKAEGRQRVLNLLNSTPKRGLIVAQALLVTAQQAMLHCPEVPPKDSSPVNIVTVYLAIADHLVEDESNDLSHELTSKGVPGALGRELISNQLFNADVDEAHVFARFNRTWLQLPKERIDDRDIVDLEEAYLSATGVPLRDVLVAGIALRTATLNGQCIIKPDYLTGLNWASDRIERALSFFTADISSMRDAIQAQQKSGKATSWSFDTFRAYPVLRDHEGTMAVIDTDLLMKRIFGWRPIFDIKNALMKTGNDEDRKQASRIDNAVRRLAEAYTAEIIDSLTGSSKDANQRAYHDEELRKAYSTKQGVKIADVAVDYGDSWVVSEITTIQLRRDSVSGISDDAVIADLNKLIEEVAQIDATIHSLRENEEALTGIEPNKDIRRQYYPLLVLTEGFPVNPISLPLLREKVAKKGLLQGEDIMPLEIADLPELEMIEGIQERGGPSLKDILNKKRSGSLHNMQIRDFILVELRLPTQRPKRQLKLYKEGLRTILSHIDPSLAQVDLPELDSPE